MPEPQVQARQRDRAERERERHGVPPPSDQHRKPTHTRDGHHFAVVREHAPFHEHERDLRTHEGGSELNAAIVQQEDEPYERHERCDGVVEHHERSHRFPVQQNRLGELILKSKLQ